MFPQLQRATDLNESQQAARELGCPNIVPHDTTAGHGCSARLCNIWMITEDNASCNNMKQVLEYELNVSGRRACGRCGGGSSCCGTNSSLYRFFAESWRRLRCGRQG
jgi:hypothetical protein